MDRSTPDRNALVRIAALTLGIAMISVTIANFFIKPPTIKGSKDVLHAAKIIPLDGARAPESVDFDPNGGGPYVGVGDGRVLKWENESVGWVEFAITSPNRDGCLTQKRSELEHVCGRPLGLHFEQRSGDLYICDCYLGLMKVGPEGGLATPVVKQVEGRPLHWTNHLDIDEENDIVYFTDSSEHFQIRTLFGVLLTQDFTGRLIRYDMKTKESKSILQGLHFPNGVALSKDRSYVLVAESVSCIIHRVWLTGPNAGKRDIFAELPGFPDNIRTNSKGEILAALHAKKSFLTTLVFNYPWVGEFLLKTFTHSQLEHYLLQGMKPHAVTVKVNEKGEIIESLEDREGKVLRIISETVEHDGKLWFGSITEPFVGVYDLNN